MPNVNVVATIKAKNECIDEVKTRLSALLEPSRKDPGCLSYHLHQDLDDPAIFVFYELWQSRELLDEHMATPHLKDLLSRADSLFASADVRVVQKIGE